MAIFNPSTKSDANILQEFLHTDYLTKRLINEFDKPLFDNLFYKSLAILNNKSNYELIKFSKDVWNSNPKQFCNDHYGTHFFDKVILLVNNIPNFFEFTNERLTYITSPRIGIIIALINGNTK